MWNNYYNVYKHLSHHHHALADAEVCAAIALEIL